ncbi:hypothetical protein [Streptosporangium sp. NPDC051022]|uniref:hypothetical protein n=1 Tax=Streptosporangium sp. NPDC051022 TaxID=3155752 RepID=UPI0034227B33
MAPGHAARLNSCPEEVVRRQPVFIVFDGVRVPEGAKTLTGTAGLDVEQVAAQEVDVPVLEGESRAALPYALTPTHGALAFMHVEMHAYVIARMSRKAIATCENLPG